MDHLTDVSVAPVTVAENICCPPALTWALNGETAMETDAADSMFTVADADLVGRATEVAVTVTVAGLGMIAGAV
jgi:hypothetical protein